MTKEKVGIHYAFPPQPPVEEDTHYVAAGAITIGVEYRELDAESLRKTYEGTKYQAIYEAGANPDLELAGVSLHVCDASDGAEYLRFDCFDGDAHYHYVHPKAAEVDNHVVWFDEVAEGSMLPWALHQLRHRLPEMLEEAGGGHLGPRLDGALIARAVEEVEQLARSAVPGPGDRAGSGGVAV
jgi:hypothetical protein